MVHRTRNPELRKADKLWSDGTHENLVQVFREGSLLDPRFYFIDMPRYDYNLDYFITSTSRQRPRCPEKLPGQLGGGLDMADVQIIMRQLLAAFTFLYDHDVIYCKLTPFNGTTDD
jgi:hypothetical protein